MELILTIVGLVGVGFILLGYGLLAAGKMQATEARYQVMNVLGTACVLVSLINEWNMPAFVTNAAWITVGLVSLVRMSLKRKSNEQ